MNPRKLLVSRIGVVLSALVTGGIAWLLSFLLERAPAAHKLATEIIDLLGGQLVLAMLVFIGIRELLNWAIARWSWINITATQVLQEAVNSRIPPEISEEVGKLLEEDGIFGQETGKVIDKLLPTDVSLPIEKLPKVRANGGKPLALFLACVAALLILLSGCSSLPGQVEVRIPLGETGTEAFFGVRQVRLWDWADAPRALAIEDFKAVVP